MAWGVEAEVGSLNGNLQVGFQRAAAMNIKAEIPAFSSRRESILQPETTNHTLARTPVALIKED